MSCCIILQLCQLLYKCLKAVIIVEWDTVDWSGMDHQINDV